MNKIITTATALLIAAALLLGVVATVDAQQREQFATLFVKVLNVTNSAAFTGPATFADAVTITGDTTTADVTIAGDAEITGAASIDGDLALGAGLGIAPQTAITVTNGGIITPTGALVLLQAASAVTATIATPADGDIAILINTTSNAITIEDTTGQTMAGNLALGAGDTLTLIGNDDAWIELSRSNN